MRSAHAALLAHALRVRRTTASDARPSAWLDASETPTCILAQSIVVVAWIADNAIAVAVRWDPYPFMLLNVAGAPEGAAAVQRRCFR